jgi:hypothetical protein
MGFDKCIDAILLRGKQLFVRKTWLKAAAAKYVLDLLRMLQWRKANVVALAILECASCRSIDCIDEAIRLTNES